MTVTGASADMLAGWRAADASSRRLELARGIQNKVLEAMAMARPGVASTPAFEGIEAVPGRDLQVADEAEEMAEAVNGLLADPERARAMGEAARRQMVESYRWEARLAPLAAMVDPGKRRRAA